MGKVFGPIGSNGNARYKKDVRIPFNIAWWRKPGGSKMNPTYDEVDLHLTDYINYAITEGWISLAGAVIGDGDKGDIVVTGSGTTWTIDSNAVSNTKLAQMAANTIKGNNTGGLLDPIDLTVSQVQELISVDHLITLTGVAESSNDLGTFTGSTIGDNLTIKQALQTLETDVETVPRLVSYTNGDAYITATGAGVTISKNTTSGIWTISVPANVDIKSINITYTLADTADAGNDVYLYFDYSGARAFNTGYDDLNMPVIRFLNTNATPSAGAPLNIVDGGVDTNSKNYGLYVPLGAGDGSDLGIKCTSPALHSTDNLMTIHFTNI